MSGMPIARIGDSCTHGATIITGSSVSTVDGRPIARVGDLISCPIEGHGINRIISISPTSSVEGRERAYVTCITECGAEIITGSSSSSTDK